PRAGNTIWCERAAGGTGVRSPPPGEGIPRPVRRAGRGRDEGGRVADADRQTSAGRRAVGRGARRGGAAHGGDRLCREARRWRAGVLSTAARGTGWPPLRQLEVPLDDSGVRLALRSTAGGDRRRSDHRRRSSRSRDRNGRAAPALEHLPWRHELRRSARAHAGGDRRGRRGFLLAAGAALSAGASAPSAAAAGTPVFDVRGHGAVGDGAADDTRAIQASIDATPSGAGVVSFPPGVYRITAPLNVIDAAGDGHRRGLRILGSAGGASGAALGCEIIWDGPAD